VETWWVLSSSCQSGGRSQLWAKSDLTQARRSRPSENLQSLWMLSLGNLAQASVCSLSERPLWPERGPMAWARLVQELTLMLFSSMFLVIGCMIDWITLFKAWSVWICMYYLIYELKLMRLVWIKSWIMIGWLVGYWYVIVMLDKSMVGWWDMAMVWDWHNSMKLLVRFHGGVRCNGRNSMNLLVSSHSCAEQ